MTDRVDKALREARTVKPTDVQQIMSRTDQQEAGMREQFEKWARAKGMDDRALRSDTINDYWYLDTQQSWEDWRAGAQYFLDHLAFVLAHGGFDQEPTGGCSCEICADLRKEIASIQKREGEKCYVERYGKR